MEGRSNVIRGRPQDCDEKEDKEDDGTDRASTLQGTVREDVGSNKLILQTLKAVRQEHDD